MLKAIFAIWVLMFAVSADAKTKEYCGKRAGTGGNAFLVDGKNHEVITLAQQGNGDTLLEQADDLIGKNSGIKNESGMQNGTKYCVVAELDEQGEPTEIIKAWLKK